MTESAIVDSVPFAKFMRNSPIPSVPLPAAAASIGVVYSLGMKYGRYSHCHGIGALLPLVSTIELKSSGLCQKHRPLQ